MPEETNPNPAFVPGFYPHMPTLLGGAENMKLLFDTQMGLQTILQKDAQGDSNAWGALKLRMAHDAHTISVFAQLIALNSGQVGSTEDNQTVSPVARGTGDVVTSAGYPANRAVDTASAGVAVSAEGVSTANQAIADALGSVAQSQAAMAQALAAIAPILVAASGNAAGTAAK